MTGSQIDLAVAGQPAVLQGRIVSLRGEEFDARVAEGNGTALDIHARFRSTPTTTR